MTDTRDNSAAKRFRMLDLLRGVTVFLMIASHAVYFFHNDTSPLLVFIENFGNTVAFSVFLIVSAATAEIAYFSKHEDWPNRRKRLLKRVSVLLGSYFVLAFMVFYPEISASHGFDRLTFIFDILTLRSLAPFAEFYIPFVVFPLIVTVFPRLFKEIKRSVLFALVFGLAIYFLGNFYYAQPIWNFLLPWKALLFGAQGYYRFPIFQYFPLYLIGLLWGSRLLVVKEAKHQTEIVRTALALALSGLVIFGLAFLITGNPFSDFLHRWPPSIPFLLVGITFASILALLFYKVRLLKYKPLLRDGILILGQNALGLALTHVFLLQIYNLAGGLRTGSVFIYLFSFLVLILLSVALAAIIPFNLRLSLNLEKGQCHEHQLEEETLVKFEEEFVEEVEAEVSWLKKFFFLGRSRGHTSQKLIKKRHILAASLLIVLSALIVFPPITHEYQVWRDETGEKSWGEGYYGWRQRLTLTNIESLAEITKGEVVSLTINHLDLVRSKKSYPDGRDLVVYFWDGKEFKGVNYWIGSPNQTTTKVSFRLVERLKNGEATGKYYLFYGNNLTETSQSAGQPDRVSAVKYTIEAGAEEAHPLLLTVDRRWLLLDDDPKVAKTVRIALQTVENYDQETVTYRLGEKKSGTLEKTSENLWEGVLDTSELEPGQYELTAVVNKDGQDMATSKTGFFVSYPLYVAWTQDWEGYNVPDSYLSAIAEVSQKHGVTMTHMWNPRLTTTETVSAGRKEALLGWVKKRKDVFHESIQLHLHMFNDFVTLAGVTPRNYPNWGDSGDGYGSLTTNYNTNELTQIISKGIEIMRSSGLGTPIIYRAGGWFANEETLLAVKNSGLKADSSGRTAYKFFEQTGPWDLVPTAQPYYPSASDQNKPGTTQGNILEIPNNGADSYWFSSDEMKNRFSANYSGGVLTEPKQLTYLSHPHWFNKKEQNKIEDVFNLIDGYKYESDNGPVMYVNLDKIYEVWAQ